MTDQLVLSGPSVTLRPLAITDAAALADAAAESRQHYIYTRVPDGVAEAESYIAAALRDRDAGHRMPFVTVSKNRIVGCTSYLDIQRWRWPAGSPLQRSDGRTRSRSARRGSPTPRSARAATAKRSS